MLHNRRFQPTLVPRAVEPESLPIKLLNFSQLICEWISDFDL